MKRSSLLALILFLLLCLSALLNLIFFAFFSYKGGSKSTVLEAPYNEEVVSRGSKVSKIAVIPISGIIGFSQTNPLGDSMVEDLKEAFRQAELDPSIKAVVLSVDSPGGEVTASDAIYHSVQMLAKKKPVVYYMNSLGASGAYYAACGASWIMCNPTTFTGSIGVIITTLNYRELLGKVGLQTLVFKSGKFKDMLNPAREMTSEEKDYIQNLVMQIYSRFLNLVASSRHLDAEKLRNGIADGRILSGEDAYREKLVDGLGYIEDAYAKAKELGNAKDASVVNYKPHFNFSKFFRIFSQSGAKIQIDLGKGFHFLEAGRLYLIPSLFVP